MQFPVDLIILSWTNHLSHAISQRILPKCPRTCILLAYVMSNDRYQLSIVSIIFKKMFYLVGGKNADFLLLFLLLAGYPSTRKLSAFSLIVNYSILF